MRLLAWLWILSLACVPSLVLAAERNVVLFVTDDLSPDLGCYGISSIRTPHIDRLAADGIRFDQAFCTTASCSASRSVILTGLYNHANAQYGHEHSYHHFRTYDRLKTLPVRMTAAGYRTARIGKYHVGPEQVYRFETVLAGNSRNAVQMAENCREFLQADDQRPFFLYFCTSDPHRGGGTVKEIPEQPNAFGNRPDGYAGVETVRYEPEQVEVPPFLPDTAVCRAELAQYYQSVSRIDQGLGRLVQELKDAGVYEQTLIIFTSDHGIAFPGGKTTLYEGGMRIPFIVHLPKLQQAGIANQALINLADVAPTILEFAGGDTSGLHGRSMLDVMHQQQPEGWDQVYASHTFHEITMYYPMRVVRTRQHKLIWNIAHGLPYPFASDLWSAPTWQDIYRQGPDALYGKRTVHQYINRAEFELYDLEQDPHETVNLAESPDHQPLLAELQARLKRFQRDTSDPWISKWEYE